jgi:hypothetical protein
MDDGFGGVRAEINDVRGELRDVRGELRGFRGEMNSRFEAVDARLDGVQRTMVYGFVSVSGAVLAGFAAIATQL